MCLRRNSNITTLADFEWVAFASRGNTDTDLRTMWKTVFTNKKTEIFEAMKPELRESLKLFDPDDLNSTKIDQILKVIIKAE